jgi:hypothetical protein
LVGTLTLVLGLGVGTVAMAHDQKIERPDTYNAYLSGQQEVPSVDTAANGKFTLTTNNHNDIEYQLTVQHGEKITAAHLHCGAMGQTGPVVVPLFHSQQPRNVDGELASGTIKSSDIQTQLQSCNPGIQTPAHLLQAIREGKIYVNVHSTDHPDGLIRGQLMTANMPAQVMNHHNDAKDHTHQAVSYDNLKDYAKYGAHVILSNYYVSPPDEVMVRGYYFWPNEQVKVAVMDKTYTVKTDNRGYFTTPAIHIPLDQAETTHTVTATGADSGLTRTATLKVGTYYPVVEPSNWYVQPGASLTFTGRNYGPNETVTMSHSAGSMTLKSNSDGVITAMITAPTHPGPYKYTFMSANSGSTYEVTVTVAGQ